MSLKSLLVGVDKFEKLIQNGYYYVDKTGLISDIINNLGEVNLFTRPRRFGKSLNMSMLQSFFEVGTDKSLFDGLAISNEKEICEQYMGKYPVVFVSLKDVDGNSFESAYNRLRTQIREEALRLSVISESTAISDFERNSYNRLRNEKDDVEDIKNSLKMFCSLLEKHYGQKVILIIDEYDVPLDKASLNGYYSQMIEIIRAMYSSALKSNDSLFFAVLTGCLRVSKESIFTGLNNLIVHSISDKSFDEYFGFTDEEVHKLLNYYSLESHYEEIKEWYDGYLFGEQKVYCPWDVINYCNVLRKDSNAKPKAYWINSSGNDIVRNLINKCDEGTTQMDIEELINGNTIVKSLNENLTHEEIYDDIDNIWSMLYMTGYLTATDYPNWNQYTLRIPNKEVRTIYTQQILKWFKEKIKTKKNDLTELFVAFEKQDCEKIENYLDDLLLDTMSYYDSYESFYHGFLLGILSQCSSWNIGSNTETGKGRCDIIIMKRDKSVGMIIEIKEVKDYDELEKACEKGMKQIEEKDYTAKLRKYGYKKILKYAIGFCEKSSKALVKQER